ncbi:hypothetical protein ACFX13_033120 [Malus domestica]
MGLLLLFFLEDNGSNTIAIVDEPTKLFSSSTSFSLSSPTPSSSSKTCTSCISLRLCNTNQCAKSPQKWSNRGWANWEVVLVAIEMEPDPGLYRSAEKTRLKTEVLEGKPQLMR